MARLARLIGLIVLCAATGCAAGPVALPTPLPPTLSSTYGRVLVPSPAGPRASAMIPTRQTLLTLSPTMVATPRPTPVLTGVKLLFVSGVGCARPAAQQPIVTEFEKRFPEVAVTRVLIGELNTEQQRLVQGTSGTPVLVFNQGSYYRQIVGQSAIDALEKEYVAFQTQALKGTALSTRTGSYIV